MAKMPVYPQVLPRPFAENGNRRTIPDTTTDQGRASFNVGFPPETQEPFSEGGIAPNRLDFQGMFNAITTMLFWQQSGGQWNYNSALGYKCPALCIIMRGSGGV